MCIKNYKRKKILSSELRIFIEQCYLGVLLTNSHPLNNQSIMAKDQEIFEKAISWVKSQGYDKIRANVEGFDAPSIFRRNQDNGEIMMPDITAVKSKRKSYFEIALKDEDIDHSISKWKLISAVASAQNSKLFLLAPHGHKAFAARTIERHDIAAEVIAL